MNTAWDIMDEIDEEGLEDDQVAYVFSDGTWVIGDNEHQPDNAFSLNASDLNHENWENADHLHEFFDWLE